MQPSGQLLLVEDNPLNAEVFQRTLAQVPGNLFEIDLAEDLRTATEYVETKHYDMIVLDLGLPDAEGLSGLHVMRHHQPDTALVVLTGSDEDELAMNALKNGAQDYLIKGQDSPASLYRALLFSLERKKAENKARELAVIVEQQRRLNELQERFIELMSHEFRTPMAILSAQYDVLKQLGHDVTVDALHQSAEKMHAACGRVLELIENIVHLTEVEEGYDASAKEPVALNAMVQDIVELYRSVNHTRRFEIDMEAVTVMADAAQLNIALQNIINNAVKYSQPDRPIRLSVKQQESQAVFCCADQGIGIKPTELPHVCERFFRSASPSGPAGVGLGLYLANAVATQHEGHLSIESEFGKGTVVQLLLPLKETM